MKVVKLGVVVVAVVMLAAVANAQIAGTGHDFSTNTWNTSGEICGPCHTPHNGSTNGAPLWSHSPTTNSFTEYTSGTLNATVGQPSGISLQCLSCHDGTVALEAYIGADGTSPDVIAGGALLGTDLSDDHPISFDYATAQGLDSGLFATNAAINALLFGGSVECSSCHDPHGAGVSSLLRMSNAGSALCITCHNK